MRDFKKEFAVLIEDIKKLDNKNQQAALEMIRKELEELEEQSALIKR